MIFYYSGCGNSKFIAKSIAEALNDNLVFIPEAQREGKFEYNLTDNEMLGFVYPIYSWRPPHLVEEFVNKLKINGKPSYVWTAVTCGDNVGETEKIFRKELETIGLSLDAAFCFKMPNTYVNMMVMSVDEPEIANEKIAKAKEKLPKVIDLIKQHATYSDKWASDKPFFSTDDCISCGMCVKVCPLQNITMENGRPHWNGHCNTCDACYHFCPKHAIHYGKKTKGKGQYHFA